LEFKAQLEAAQAAAKAERFVEAGHLYLAVNQPYEAAINFQKGKALKECLEALLKVSRSSVSYRAACVHATRVAGMLGEPMVRLALMVGPFLDSPPSSPAEATAMKELAGARPHAEAMLVYRRVLSTYPQDQEAQDALAELQRSPKRDAASPASRAPDAPPPRPSAPRHGSKRFTDVLIARGRLTKERLSHVITQQREVEANDLSLGEALVADGHLSELDVVKALAEASGHPYISGERLLGTATPEALMQLTVEKAERFKACPIALVDRTLYVAMRDPRDFQQIDQLRFASGHPVKGVFASEIAIRKSLQKHYHQETINDIAQEDWRSWDQMPMVTVSRFSDRFTGTREHEFDTAEMIARLAAPGPDEAKASEPRGPRAPPAAGPAPSPKPDPLTAATIDTLRPLMVGSLVANRYRIEGTLGQGGSATVFKVHDNELDEKVAMKVFAPSARSDSQVLRYKNELSLSRQLTHPNIIRLFDLGAHEEWRYLTMELLEGVDLASKLEALHGPLPLAEGLLILEGACAGLQYAHDNGVIHRDIKPGNLFITREGVVKVMDFGIAKKERTQHITQEGTIAGTPEYMSPEQISGFSTVSHLTDVYALGCTAYATFSGAPPFGSPEVMAVLMQQVNNAPPPLRAKNGAVPAELERVVLKLLEKDPAKRFQSCAEVSVELRRIRLGLPR
jgi:serine/threonine-protein kinase